MKNQKVTERTLKQLRWRKSYGWWIVALSEVLGWFEGVVYTGHTVKRGTKEWMLIIRAEKKNKGVVSMYFGPHELGCWMSFTKTLKHSKVVWKEDVYWNRE